MLFHLHSQATYHCPAGDCVAICREGTPKVRRRLKRVMSLLGLLRSGTA